MITHKEVHIKLHESLDELVADFIRFNPDKRLLDTSIMDLMDLMDWSCSQTINPTESEQIY